jgi:hypothetical protein
MEFTQRLICIAVKLMPGLAEQMRRFLSLAHHAAEHRHADATVDDDASLAKLTERWRTWQLSNLDYLLRLNVLAGRRGGDRAFAPMLPWVLDFSAPPEPDMDTLTVMLSQ